MDMNATKTSRQDEIGSGTRRPLETHAPEPAATLARDWAPNSRLAHAAVAAGLAVMLMLAWFLTPDARGIGTHEQLLLLPCNFYRLTELPCPFCGMTTAFAHMARGQVAQALLAQPIGAAGFVACVLLLPVAIGAAVTGKDALRHFTRLLWNARLSWVLVGMLGAAWAFKIALTLARR